MKTITLTKGLAAIVDDCDYRRLSKIKWCAVWNGRAFYATTSNRQKGNYMAVRMHRLIVYAPRGMEVDHANGNTLDNRRANLRLATNSQNGGNRKISRTNTSGFKGVIFDKQDRCWKARIRFRGKAYSLGCFATAEQAAKAYDQAAIDFHGQFARTNFRVPGFQCVSDLPPKISPAHVEPRILRGENHPQAKLSNNQVRAIRCAFKSASARSLAEVFNVSAGAISHIRTGRRWGQEAGATRPVSIF